MPVSKPSFVRTSPRRIVALALAAATSVGAARITTAALAPTTGCSPNRPAIAADASGKVLKTQPRNAPIPCGSTTGFNAGETRIYATNHAVIYAPAIFTPGPAGLGYGAQLPGPRFQLLTSPGGLAVTRNNGASWRAVLPMGMTWVSGDEQEYVDRTTGRFFFYNFGGNPFPQTAALSTNPDAALPPGVDAHLMWTADDGHTWHHSTACCPLFSENPRFAAARAPSGRAKPAGYPNVLYFCGNATIMLDNGVPGARICSRSLDGGSTWSFASILASHPVPQHSECGSSGEDFGAGDGNYPQAEPDGSLVVMVSCGKRYLARSTDEGATWPITRTIPAFDELRTDTAGNLYGFDGGGGRVVVRVSRDLGRSWSAPIVMTAPGVTVADSWNPAVRAPGNAAVSYYGQRAGQAPKADGYLTVTRDALARAPIVWSAVLNDPRTAMLNDGSSRPPPGDTGYTDFNGSDIAPDGTAWASFIQDCASTDVAPPCGDGKTHAMYGTRGFAGRLVWPT